MLLYSLIALMFILYIVYAYALYLDGLNTATQKTSTIAYESLYDRIVHERGHDPLITQKDVSHA